MLESPVAVLAGRREWAKEPRYEVAAVVMTARLTLGMSDVQCSYADSMVHALFTDGAAWVKVEDFSPAAALDAGRVLP